LLRETDTIQQLFEGLALLITMARRYDSSTTTFSPEGRLHQVEYAIEAINNAGTCVGILAKDGIVMASERKVTSALLAPSKVIITAFV